MARLGDIFQLQIPGEWGCDCNENEKGTKVLRTTNFCSDGTINYDNIILRKIETIKINRKRLHSGDIIL